MSAAGEKPPGGTIRIGVRQYHAATGEFPVIREPETTTGHGPLPAHSRFPLCQCPQAPECHERENQYLRKPW